MFASLSFLHIFISSSSLDVILQRPNSFDNNTKLPIGLCPVNLQLAYTVRQTLMFCLSLLSPNNQYITIYTRVFNIHTSAQKSIIFVLDFHKHMQSEHRKKGEENIWSSCRDTTCRRWLSNPEDLQDRCAQKFEDCLISSRRNNHKLKGIAWLALRLCVQTQWSQPRWL